MFEDEFSLKGYLAAFEDTPVLPKVVIIVTAQKMAHKFLGNDTMGSIKKMTDQLVDEYQKAFMIPRSFMKRRIKDAAGRWWFIEPKEKGSGGLVCQRCPPARETHRVVMDNIGLLMIPAIEER
jgi:hypothetical protein